MHTIDLLDEALSASGTLGYRLHREWLNGAAGGDCELNGRKHLYLDLSMSVPDQFRLVLDVLHREMALTRLELSPALRQALVAYQARINRAA